MLASTVHTHTLQGISIYTCVDHIACLIIYKMTSEVFFCVCNMFVKWFQLRLNIIKSLSSTRAL